MGNIEDIKTPDFGFFLSKLKLKAKNFVDEEELTKTFGKNVVFDVSCGNDKSNSLSTVKKLQKVKRSLKNARSCSLSYYNIGEFVFISSDLNEIVYRIRFAQSGKKVELFPEP